MPVKNCRENGKPGFKWGNSGKCYTYTPGNEQSRKRARDKAVRQGRAIQVNNSIGTIQDILASFRDALGELTGLIKQEYPVYNTGLYLKQRYTKLIHSGTKTMIIKTEKTNIENQKLLIFDDEFAYGYIILSKPILINDWKEFRYYRDDHQMPIEECLDMNWTFPVYGYIIEESEFYDKPKGVSLPLLETDILEEAERYINDTGEIIIEDRIIGDE